jgi:hypothetical protein
MTASGTLTIGTLRTRLVVSREHADHGGLRTDIQSALVGHLRESLARQLGDSDSNQSVWVIRSVRADALVNAVWDADEIANAVAAGVARSLSRTMVGSGDGINAIRFDSRAAHLAQYLLDRLDHTANRWYHARFDGLRALPASAAIRTALTANPALGLSALQHLTHAARRRVAETMTTTDCRRVLHDFGLLPDRGGLGAALEAVTMRWSDGQRPDREDAAAVWLLATVSGDAVAGATLERAIDLVVQTAAAQKRSDRAPAGALSVEAAFMVKALSGARTKVESNRSWSSAGGVFLLLPYIDVKHLRQLSWRIVEDDSLNARGLALMTLGVALHGTWSSEFGRDLVLLDLFGIPGEIDLSQLWAGATAVEQAAIHGSATATLSRFARRLPGFSSSTPAYLRSNALSIAAAIEREPDRIVVRLSRPPLYVILAMTGLIRRRYEIDWLSEVPFDVFPEDSSS